MNQNIYEEIHFNDDLEFPFKVYHSDESTFIHKLPTHFHKEMEIIYFKKGGVFYELENIPYKINDEAIVIFPPNSYHKGTVFDYESHNSDIYIFNLEILGTGENVLSLNKYLNPILNNEVSYPAVIYKDNVDFDILASSLMSLNRIFDEKKKFFELDIRNELLKFFIFLYKSELLKNRSSSKEEKMASLIFSYIHKNYKNEISREELTRMLKISESHFTRIFKKISGKTFTEYLNFYRIIKSKYYLIYTKKTITEIAYDCGFQDLSYYNKVFNKFEKSSPKNYRKNLILGQKQ